MQTFTIGFGRWWCVRALGRNRLARATDRIEAVAVLLAVMVVFIAIPIVAAIGTSVHDARVRAYSEEAQTRHTVAAIAVADSSAVAHPTFVDFTVRVKWSAEGADHIATLNYDQPVRAGEAIDVWVDDTGAHSGPPAPAARAGFDAVGVAVASWAAVIAAAAGITLAIRWTLDRRRYAEWEREINALANGNDGLTNRQP